MMRAPVVAVTLAALTASAGLAQSAGAPRSVRVIDEAPAEPAASEPAPRAATLPPPAAEKSDGLRVETLPQREFTPGASMRFRVTAEKAGYLVLVDVDARGKLTQIYPNMITLANPGGVDERANYLRAGQSTTLPEGPGRDAFSFIASPPQGVGMVVAILSDAPVQIVDLPDVPEALAGRSAGADFVRQATHSLDILPADGSRPARKPKWRFATAYYAIK